MIIDIANPGWKEQLDVVENVLEDIDSSGNEIIKVFNKIDLIENTSFLNAMRLRYPSSVFVSGKTQVGIEDIKNSIGKAALKGKIIITMEFGPENNDLISSVYRYGTIIETRKNDNSFTLTFSIPVSVAKRIGFSEKHIKMNMDTS